MAEKLCSLCGGDYHAVADEGTDEWLGLRCPSENGTPEDQQTYLSDLAEKFAEYWEREVIAFFAWEDGREARNEAWDHRTRADGRTVAELPDTAQVSTTLVEDCQVRAGEEIGRQKREEVFQPYGEFDVEVPHLTVPGKVPLRPAMVKTRKERLSPSSDALLYLGDADE